MAQNDDIEDYPDLSDIDSDKQQQEKNAKIKKEQNIESANKISKKQAIPQIMAPSFLGGGVFKPPPPPGGRPNIEPKIMPQIHNKVVQPQFYPHPKQRKNCLYIKNIPKTLNKPEKLTIFFRTYGNIKLVKSNEEDKSALVRFQKQQDALKFVNLKVKIFNRSFIVYNLHEVFQVPSNLKQQCEKDQNKNTKTVQHEVVKLRQAAQTIIADKYRALLFLKRQDLPRTYLEQIETTKDQIQKQMIKCRKIAQADSHDEEVNQMLTNIQNQYDWTVIIQSKTKAPIEKKKVIQQYIKYGPIGQVQIRLQSIPNGQDPQQKLGIVKIKYLGVKSSWEMFKSNVSSADIGIEGNKIKKIFTQWQLTLPKQEPKQDPVQEPKQEPKQDLKEQSQKQAPNKEVDLKDQIQKQEQGKQQQNK